MDVRIKQKFIGGGRAGLLAIRFHDLRHSYASWLIGHGESLSYVKEQ
jgi:integrase